MEDEEDGSDPDDGTNDAELENVEFAKAHFRTSTGFKSQVPVKFCLASCVSTTATKMTEAMRSADDGMGGKEPAVISIEFGNSQIYEIPATMLSGVAGKLRGNMTTAQGTLLAAKRLHDFVRDQMGTEFEVAAAALAAGKHAQAASLAKAAHNSRRVEGARDLNRCYTNQAVTMCITAMSAMVSAVMIVNAGALTSQNRDRALRKLADVQADAHEALTGTLSTTGEPWILAGQDAHADAGLILRGNLQELDTIAQQLAAAVRGIPVTNRALSFD